MKNLSISLLIAITMMIAAVKQATAQAENLAPTQANDGTQQSEYDSTTGSFGGGNFNPLDLIHRANTAPSRNMDDFNSDSQKNIEDAATEFKQQQQQRINNQPTPVNNTPQN